MQPISLVLTIACLCALALAGCAPLRPVEGRCSVVASGFPGYDFARAIAGDLAEVSLLLPPGQESHSFEPTPPDILKIQRCDVFIYGGGESDEWVRGILDSMDTSRMRVVTLMDCVEPLEEEDALEPEAFWEAEDELALPEYDEHVWTSPRNAARIVLEIHKALRAADPANAEAYMNNELACLQELDALDARIKEIVAQGRRKTLVFGDRFPFRYFADAYGLRCYAAFRGCSTETEPSPNTVRVLIEKIKAEGIPVVFCIELSDRRMAEMIGDNTGARVLRMHSCHNVSKEDFDAGKTYLDFMNENAEALREALE